MRNYRFYFFVLSLLIISCKSNNEDIILNPKVELSRQAICLDSIKTYERIYIRNTGNVPLDWELECIESKLNCEPGKGNLEPEDSIAVEISTDINLYKNGVHTTNVKLVVDQIPSSFFNVDVIKYKEEKWILPEKIVDAEFDKNKNLIIAITKESNGLLIIDPLKKKIDKIELGISPKCISISQDGKYAAIGHKAVLSYVNISTKSVERVVGLTMDIYDVVLAPNGWIYLFPDTGGWTDILCINLNTNEQRTSFGNLIYDRTVAKLHPSGKYIYGATHLIPADFEKYKIINGRAENLYDSPYHGDHHLGINLWISEDGNYLFSEGGDVFSSSEIDSLDMIYKGGFIGIDRISTLDYSVANKKISIVPLGIDGIPSNEIKFFNFLFEFQESIILPDHLVFGKDGRPKILTSGGYFGFFNANGDKYHVLSEVNDLLFDSIEQWSLVTFNVN